MHTVYQVLERNDSRVKKVQPAALILDEQGIIRDCCQAGELLFGYHRGELLQKHVSELLPQLSETPLIQNGSFNPRLDFLCHCGHRFVAQNCAGSSFFSELHFVCLQHGDRTKIRLIVRPAAERYSGVQALFMRRPAMVRAG